MKKEKIIIANWKMNFLFKDAKKLLKKILKKRKAFKHNVIICPSTSIISSVQRFVGNKILLGAQNCHYDNFGPFTGDDSASMLKNIGCKYVIIGHSERRIAYFESNELIKKKIQSANKNRLNAVVCIGESLSTKKQNKTEIFLSKQLNDSLPKEKINKGIIIAYEPIWAIGSGVTPKIDEISKLHLFIKKTITKISSKYKNVKILYGGSVNEKNAKNFLNCNEVDGFLLGGASLKSKTLLSILSI